MRTEFSPDAVRDLRDVFAWIAQSSPVNANRFVGQLERTCLSIADKPLGFPLLARYALDGYRKRSFKNYLIFYRATPERVEIIRILHGARDYEALLPSGDI